MSITGLAIAAWVAFLVLVGVFMSGVRRVSSARTAAAREYWESEGRVVADAAYIVDQAAALGRES